METLKLDCDSVTSVAASIDSIATQMTELGEKIKEYEIPEDDDFNFTTPRSAIAANVLNSAEKITNTSKIITSVVDAHTEIQTSLTFDTYVEEKERKAEEEAAAAAAAAEGRTYYTAAAAYAEAGAYYSNSGSTTLPEAVGVTEEPEETKTIDKLEGKEIKNTIEFGEKLVAPTLGYVISTNLTEENKIDDRLEEEYDEKTGLAKVDDMYVVRCDSSLGKVGDIIVITTASGATLNCVIGSTYTATEGKETTLEFYSNSKEEVTEVEGIPGKDDAITKVDNYGSIDEEKFKEDETKDDQKSDDDKKNSDDKDSKDDKQNSDDDKTNDENQKSGDDKQDKNNQNSDDDKTNDENQESEDDKQDKNNQDEESQGGYPEVTVGHEGTTEVTINDSTPVSENPPENKTNPDPTPVTPVYNWNTEEPEVHGYEEENNTQGMTQIPSTNAEGGNN